MIFTDRNHSRAYSLGPHPLEALARDERVAAAEIERPASAPDRPGAPPSSLGRIVREYRNLFDAFRDGEVASGRAPVPDDPGVRAADVKGFGYFLDAAHVGICRVPKQVWLTASPPDRHDHAIVIVVEHGRLPEAGNSAREWVRDAVDEAGQLRAAEITVCLARYLRALGFSARAEEADAVDVGKLAVLAGVAGRADGRIASPFLGTDISLAAVTTEYVLACDAPLAAGQYPFGGRRYQRGINGALSGRERARRARRPSHASRYPMEQVRRVARPTTLILDDEVPRVPKRANFFGRAARGDLGAKAQREVRRFIGKSPYNVAMFGPMSAMVPHQDGAVADTVTTRNADPVANANALKSLGYFLGADLVGICEVPRYAWYSHGEGGEPIEPYHRYAVVMLIDQGFETMEGASGDDWISGAQSMRAYMRGAEIAGVMAAQIRELGFPARAQTNADSDVLHIPLLLWAGLGELSRIGELVLNPFVGPRFKSVVVTMDMPVEIDRPIDFGLQYFCSHCYKCARECPCDAMSFGGKVVFNGYEMWKPDVERCARYRITNPKGSACGRCMKTCPLNKVPTLDGPLVHRLGTWLGIHARWLKPLLVPIAVRLDDWLGYGRRNSVKRWWVDVEIDDGVGHSPTRGTNERELDLEREVPPANHRVACYPASANPPPDESGPVPVERKAALAAAAMLETPDEALRRHLAGGPAPASGVPTPPTGRPTTPEAGRVVETLNAIVRGGNR